MNTWISTKDSFPRTDDPLLLKYRYEHGDFKCQGVVIGHCVTVSNKGMFYMPESVRDMDYYGMKVESWMPLKDACNGEIHTEIPADDRDILVNTADGLMVGFHDGTAYYDLSETEIESVNGWLEIPERG